MPKALDAVKYIGKNFWKVLPMGSAVNFFNNKKTSETKNFDTKGILHSAYATLAPIVLTIYLSIGFTHEVWTPKEHRELNRKLRKFYDSNDISDLEKTFSFQDTLNKSNQNKY